MGRLDENANPQSSDQIPFEPPPQGYPNLHDQSVPPPSPPQQDAYMADNNQNMTYPQSTRSYIPQPAEPSPPPPEAYPPQKPATYPPPQQPPAAYLPPQQPPAAYPPQQAPAAYPPQPEPVAFPPQPAGGAASYAQNYNYSPHNAPPVAAHYGAPAAGYQTPVKMGAPSGIAIGSQYLAPTQEWSTGLFDCMDDPESAIVTACFPCVTFGQIAEVVDNGQTSCATSGLLYGVIAALIGFPCIMSCSYRTKIRSRYGLMETPAPDWVTHCLCEWCALCQEYRELRAHGLDPAIGWQANLAKNQQMQQYTATTPPMNQTMMG